MKATSERTVDIIIEVGHNYGSRSSHGPITSSTLKVTSEQYYSYSGYKGGTLILAVLGGAWGALYCPDLGPLPSFALT